MRRRLREAVALPPCFHLADDVFPKVRAEAARRLVEEGWSQVRIAQAVGISQGMVSKHVAAKPEKSNPLVMRLTDDLLAALQADSTSGPSLWCSTLTVADAHPDGEAALADLLEAETLLRAAAPLQFMPQIGLNVARALPAAGSPAEVLSYPGRLVDAGGRLVAPAPPAFGASGHLARCLLHLRTRDPGILAICNIKGGAKTVQAAKRLGWHVTEIAANRRGDAEAPFRRAVDAQTDTPQVLHDGKAPGIEPCLYVAGASARDVVRRLLELEL